MLAHIKASSKLTPPPPGKIGKTECQMNDEGFQRMKILYFRKIFNLFI